ncbi:winged helix-turn-helix transcriptional regulator [Haloferacaceae archaeon DSL9]
MDESGVAEWQETWHRIHETVSGKWALHILRLLAEDSYGFNEMQRALDGITAKTLSERLSQLRCSGFVERTVEPTSPPSSTYRLSSSGREFVALLKQLEAKVSVVDCPTCEDCSILAVGDGDSRSVCSTDC